MRGALPQSLERNPELDSWIRIGPDGTVTLYTGKVELGQGIRSALARIGAEELDVALERVVVCTADTAIGPNEGITAGSGSIEGSGSALRQAAAEARRHLLELASEQLGVPPAELRVRDGVVLAPDGERRTTYWELLGGKRFHRKATGTALPKPAAEYALVGKPGPRIDLRALVTGEARFVHDLELPGMLHARVARPPGYRARLLSCDEAAVRAMPGVVGVVRDGSFLAVAAEREEQAVAACEALARSARWEEEPEPLPDEEELWEHLLSQPAQSFLVVDGTPIEGDPGPAPPPVPGAISLEATYCRPYHMHASLGPSAALARWVDGELTVWTHSQGVALLQPSIARALGIEPSRIRAIHVPGPGCYGHNGADDAAFDACLIARAHPGRPIRLQWSREDEHAFEPYGPAMVVQLRATLGDAGRIVDWGHDVWSNSHMGRPLPYQARSQLLAAWHRAESLAPPRPRPALAPHAGIHRNADPLYAIPRRRIVKHLVEPAPLRTSSTRSLGAYANVFAIESFVDELAHAAGADPVEFRLRHLDDERARAVVEAAAERAGWGDELPSGCGRGVGFARYKNEKCYAAVVVELDVDRESGAIRLRRAVIAGDAGQVVDPDGLANQLEGGVVQAASWTLKERVRFDRRRVTSVDWERYPILTFPEAPEVETVLLDHPDLPSLGAGEATQGPAAGAIANALFAAAGVRLRRIPFTPDRVRVALAAGREGRRS